MATPNPILKMKFGSFYIPKDNPSKPLGEDAHFISAAKQTAGVADGVGGWAAKGIDAGVYARELMANCAAVVANERGGRVDLGKVLAMACSRTAARGSSTACMVSLDGAVLRSALVGDSGYAVFRDKKCIHRSPVQQRGFNHPYQLKREPGPSDLGYASREEVPVAAGDVVVVGTDGLFDNAYTDEIGELSETPEPGDLAWELAALALYNSNDDKYDSPFAVAARAAGRQHTGGKIDDITIIVARIVGSH